MLRNHRSKIPYAAVGMVILCITVLAILEIRGSRGEEKTPYVPMVRLYGSREDSLLDHARTDRLPLSYLFSEVGYQVDIPGIHYQMTGSGVAGWVEDALLWLYISEYDREERGISMALNDLPPLFLGSAYNRNSSYIAREESQEGYLAGLPVEYVYGEINLAQAGGQETDGILTVFDFTVGDKGVCVAAMTTGSAKQAKDACRDQAWEIALTMRLNPDFTGQQETDRDAGEVEEVVSLGYKIEEMAVAELGGEKDMTDREEADGLKTQYVEPAPTPQPAPTPEPVPTQEPTPVPDPALALPGVPKPIGSQQPYVDLADVNEQSFKAPLTGVAMSVTVTLGVSGNSSVTVLCPDGTVLSPSSVNENVFSFYTTSQPGTYVVVTTGYSMAGSVSVHVHCG